MSLEPQLRPFEEVVAEHGATVLRVCRALLDRSDAEDAWSETFLSAMRAYPELPPGSNVRGWLVTIAHRKAIDQIRRASRAPRPVDVLPEPAAHEQPADGFDDDLRAAVERLPTKQRYAVIYHHIAGLPYAQVGALIGSSEAAARRSAADGIARLRVEHTTRRTTS